MHTHTHACKNTHICNTHICFPFSCKKSTLSDNYILQKPTLGSTVTTEQPNNFFIQAIELNSIRSQLFGKPTSNNTGSTILEGINGPGSGSLIRLNSFFQTDCYQGGWQVSHEPPIDIDTLHNYIVRILLSQLYGCLITINYKYLVQPHILHRDLTTHIIHQA